MSAWPGVGISLDAKVANIRCLDLLVYLLLLYGNHKSLLMSFSSDLNYRHRNAQMASRASVELHTIIYFRTRYVY